MAKCINWQPGGYLRKLLGLFAGGGVAREGCRLARICLAVLGRDGGCWWDGTSILQGACAPGRAELGPTMANVALKTFKCFLPWVQSCTRWLSQSRQRPKAILTASWLHVTSSCAEAVTLSML